MHYRTLLGSVGVIAILLTGLYFGLNKKGEEVALLQNEKSGQTAKLDTVTEYEDGEEGDEEREGIEEVDGEEEDDEDETVTEEAPAHEESAEQTTSVTNSTPTPTPAPKPTPTPAPAPSAYTAATVALHDDATSCWTIINGTVYDLTSFISRHPGGESRILKICGKDGTQAFEAQHEGDSKPESMLAKFRLAELNS